MADVPMPEGFVERPAEEPMPEGFTEQPVEPPAPVDPTLPPSGSSAPAPSNEVVGFTADQLSAEVEKTREEKRADDSMAQWNRLNAAFASPLFTSEDDAASTLSISKRLGIPTETVRANLKEFRATAEEAEFNPDEWVKRNPRLAKLLNRHHELAPSVLRSKTLGNTVIKFEEALSWVKEKLGVLSEEDLAEDAKVAKVMAEGDDAEVRALEAELPADQTEQRTRVRREQDLAKATAPKQALEVDDALAKIIREKSGLDYANALAWQRTIEGLHHNKRSLRFEELMRARFLEEHGGTPARSSIDIEFEIHDEDMKFPTRAFGDDTGAARLEGVAAQGVSSTLGAGVAAVKAGGVGFGAGALFGGAVTGAITRNPAAALEGAVGMGKLVGGKAATGAALLEMYRYETGASFERNLTARTEEGKLLTNDEAMGGAVLEGLFKSALEGFSFSKQAQVFKGALPGAVKAALQRDPTFRRLIAKVAKDYFESIATETVTEGLQQAVEQAGEYLTKSAAEGRLQDAKVFRPGEIVGASEGGFMGAVALGALPAAITTVSTPTVQKSSRLALERTADARAEKADQVVGPILDMAAEPLAQGAAPEFAGMIKEASAEHGAPIESLHVDAQAVRAYFQKDGPTVQDEALIDATGDETAPQRLADALEQGTKFEIPIQQVLAGWGASQLGKAMRDHTSTSATALSPLQREEQKAALKEQAKQVEDELGAELTQEEELDAEREKIEQSVTEQRGAKEGKRIGTLFAHFWRTSASEFRDLTPADIAQTFLTRFFEGDNLEQSQSGRTEESLVDPGMGEAGDPMPVVGEDAGAAVLEATAEMSPDQRARALFIDKASGLRSERAWNMTPRTPGKQVLVLTTADMKAINDDPSGGHDTTNDLLRVIGREVVKFDPRAALAGPDFRLEIDPGKAEEVRAAVQAALPPGIVLDAGVGTTAEEASKAAGASVDAKRASGEYGARGSTKFDTAPLKAPGFRFSKEEDAFAGGVSDDLMAHVVSGDVTPGAFEDQGAFIKEAMYDPKMPGVLSKTGFEAVGERDHVMALDGVGLRDLNLALGKEAGNVYLAIIASIARDLGGEGLFFAHLSGDEYAAKSDDRAVLESFARDLQAELRQVIVEAKAADGKLYRITPAVRHGIGEKTYGNADRALNADKRGEAARGVVRGSAFAEVVGDSSVVPRRGNLEAVGRRAEARRGDQTNAVGARAQGEDAEFDPEALSPGSTRAPSKSTHSAEQMTEARAAVERMQTRNRLRFARFLDFVEGWATGAERPAGMISPAEERKFAKRFGIVDPETGFAVIEGQDAGANPNAGRKKNVERSTAGKERQRDQRLAFDKNVLGRVNQENQAEDDDEDPDQKTDRELFINPPKTFWRVQHAGDHVSADHRSQIGSEDDELGYESGTSSTFTLKRLKKWARGGHANYIGDLVIVEFEGNLIGHGTDGEPVVRPSREVRRIPFTSTAKRPTSIAIQDIEVQKGETKLFATDPNNPKVPKGYTLMPTAAQGRRMFDVFLNAKSDASTAIHEAGHVFLEIMGELAARADAGARTRQKWLDTLKWMGTTEEKWSALNQEEKTVLHEKFAEAFEVYAAEGSAPSLSLEGVFVRFRDWMLEVFRTLKAQRAPINDNIRSVFDRMLATDDEIRRHLGQRGRPLFDNAKDAGMTDSQWADKLEADAESRHFANRKVWLRAKREQLREKDATWKEELRAEEKAAEKRYDKLPAVIAMSVLDGTLADTDAVVLDRKQVVDAVGRKASRRFRTSVTGGRNIDEVGIAAQFPNGKAMLEAVSALPGREEWVAAEADAAMKKKHGDLLTERTTLQKEVAGGLHEYVEKQQIEEWAALNRGIKPGMGAPVVPAEAIRDAAGNMISRRAVKALSGARVLAAERTAATAKAAHAAKGEFDMATAAAKRQLLNSYLYRETLKALDEKEELEDLAKRLAKTSSQAKLGKASKEYRDAANFILETLGLKSPTGVTSDGVRGRAVVDRAVAEMNGSGFAIGDPEWKTAIDGVLTGQAAYRTGDRMAPLELGNLTVLGMRAVKDALKSLDAAANARNTILREGKRVDIERSEAEIIANLESTKSKKPTPATKGTETAGEQLRGLLSQADGFLRNPIDKLRELVDDDQESEAFKVLVNPVRAAKYRENALMHKVIEPIIKAMERMSKETRANLRAPLPADLFPEHTTDFSPPRYRHELLVMALNYGNESNAQRLRDGRNVTDAQVKNALNLLTKEELAWAQQVFDSAEMLRPEAFALEERLSGLPVKAIKARPLALANGNLAGGYFPVVYERAASVAGEKQEASRVLDPNYTRPNTPHSHLKGRADKVEAVISLAVGNVYRGLAQTAHDIAFREALLSGASMVLRPKVQKALKERMGPDGAEQFMRWYTDIGGAQRGARNVHERAVSWIRSNMAPALLGLRPSTALGDFANLLAAVPSTALKLHHLSSGLNAYLEAPLKSRELALSKSEELRFMENHLRKMYDEHLRDFTQRGLLERGPAATRAVGRGISQSADWLKDNSFFFMETVAKVTATPVWLGAYRQALTEGKPEAEAVRWADDILTQVFPSHSAVEQSALLRDKGYVGLTTVFGGYLNTVYRANARLASPLFTTAFEHSSLSGKAKTIGGVAASLLAFTVAWQLFGELFMGKGAEAGDDDEEDPDSKALRWRNWAGRKLLTGPLQALPLISEVANTIDAKLTGRQTHGRGGLVAEFVFSLGKGLATLADEDKSEVDKLEAVWRILGATKGMPQGMNKSLRYLLEVGLGERVVESPGRAVGGGIYGERDEQPDNVPQAVGDALAE